MKKLLLFTLFLTQILLPQLKEMEVKPTENRGGIPIFRDYPDKAGIIFYSQYDNLTFYSKYGIHKVMGDPTSGKYIVIIEPARQSFEIRCTGHKSEIIKIESLQPRDVLYYEVSPKKEEGIQSIKELGVTVQVAPSDAEIMIDGESFPHNRTKNLSIGKHRLKIQRKYYVTYHEDIVVSTGTTLFQVELYNDVTMVKVDGGTFMMGSNDGTWHEKPVHNVTVSNFIVGKYEVTQELWESIMGSNPSYSKGIRRPVENVTWKDAVEFCNRLSEKEGLEKAYSGSGESITCDFTVNGYRLPTEAEWEYAARGGNKSKGYKYSGSNDINALAWYKKNSGDKTHEVGTKQPNELSLYDMSGNVEEWVWDWYDGYSSASQTNPKGPNSGSPRVLRGGGWGDAAKYCSVASRSYTYDPESRNRHYGFRLVRTKK